MLSEVLIEKKVEKALRVSLDTKTHQSHHSGQQRIMRSLLRDREAALGLCSNNEGSGDHVTSTIHIHDDDNAKAKEQGERKCESSCNPTVLSRLITHQKYLAAVRRLAKHRNEAKIWVCTRRTTDPPGKSPRDNRTSNEKDTLYSFRQLPIHTACNKLFQEEDKILRGQLENLISHLTAAYPEGCAMRDHNGQLPLHEAIWNNASPNVISMLLMAAPSTMNQVDRNGRTPMALNQLRQGNATNSKSKNSVHIMLQKDEEFWTLARQEAMLRLKHRDPPQIEDGSVASIAVLASSVCDDSTLASEWSNKESSEEEQDKRSETDTSKGEHLPSHDGSKFAWSQLEEQARLLEDRLFEALEENHQLSTRIRILEDTNQNASTESATRISALENENEELRKHIQQLEKRLLEPSLRSDHITASHTEEDPRIVGEGLEEVLLQEVEQLKAQNRMYEQQMQKFGLLSVSSSSTKTAETEESSRGSEISSHGSEESLLDIEQTTMCSFSYSLSESPELRSHVSCNDDLDTLCTDDRDLDTVLMEAEKLAGCKLSSKIVKAWNTLEIVEQTAVSSTVNPQPSTSKGATKECVVQTTRAKDPPACCTISSSVCDGKQDTSFCRQRVLL